MKDNAARLQRVRELLSDGRLPSRRPERTLAGLGSGRDSCLVCEELMKADQVVWKMEVGGPSATTFQLLHVFCFRLVELHWRLFPPGGHPRPRFCRSSNRRPATAMNDDPTLHEKVGARLREGQLPARRPDRVWGGPSSGSDRCLVCEEVIPQEQVVWEAEFDGPSGSTCHTFHVSCFRVLDRHWRSLDASPDGPPGGEGSPA